MSKGPDRVVGIYPHSRGGFEIKIVCGGKPASEYRKTPEAAEQRAAEMRQELAAAPQSTNGASPHTKACTKGFAPAADSEGTHRQRMLGLLEAGARAVAADPSDEALQRAVKAVSSAATASAKLLAARAVIEEGDEPEDIADADFWVELATAARESVPRLPQEVRGQVAELGRELIGALESPADRPS